jgi:hypothetical protein
MSLSRAWERPASRRIHFGGVGLHATPAPNFAAGAARATFVVAPQRAPRDSPPSQGGGRGGSGRAVHPEPSAVLPSPHSGTAQPFVPFRSRIAVFRPIPTICNKWLNWTCHMMLYILLLIIIRSLNDWRGRATARSSTIPNMDGERCSASRIPGGAVRLRRSGILPLLQSGLTCSRRHHVLPMRNLWNL